MRVLYTQQSTKHFHSAPHTSRHGWRHPTHRPSPDVAPVGRVIKEQFVLQSRQHASTGGHPPHVRLCGNLTLLQEHINSAVMAIKHPRVRHVGGEPAYSKCGLYDVTLHCKLYHVVMSSLDWQNKMQQLII
jgi:hypothetical protein